MGSHQLHTLEPNHVITVDEDLQATFDQFFAPVSFDAISSMVSRYNDDLVRMKNLAALMATPDAEAVLHHFIEGNKPDERFTLPKHVSGLFALEGAVAQLNATYWSQALDATDVRDYMPQARRNEWAEQIMAPQGVLKRGSKTEYEVLPLPAFEENTVRATLISLLNSRSRFFAERVEGVFRSLSRTHVTNQPEGFRKRMILPRLINGYGSVEQISRASYARMRSIVR